MKFVASLAVSLLVLFAAVLNAADDNTKAKPLNVLYITGGGYHDYEKLTPLLTDGMKKHANVEFDVKPVFDTFDFFFDVSP